MSSLVKIGHFTRLPFFNLSQKSLRGSALFVRIEVKRIYFPHMERKMRRKFLFAMLPALLTSAAILPVLAHSGHEGSDMEETAVPQTAEGEGIVKSIDLKAEKITLEHGPIAALNWPAMTMTFRVASPSLLDGVNVGTKVHFVLKNDNGKPVVSEIHPL